MVLMGIKDKSAIKVLLDFKDSKELLEHRV